MYWVGVVEGYLLAVFRVLQGRDRTADMPSMHCRPAPCSKSTGAGLEEGIYAHTS